MKIMPKEIQNKIDEEFLLAWDKSYGRAIYGELGFQTTDGEKFEVDKKLVLYFLHSKRQEAYELGRRDERERIIEALGELTHYHNDKGVNEIKDGLAYIEVEELNNVIKSLQTNKE